MIEIPGGFDFNGFASQKVGNSGTGLQVRPLPKKKAFRSKYNTALHQTANAVAKQVFLKYLDTVVSKLPSDAIRSVPRW